MRLDKRHLSQVAFPVLYQCLFIYLLFIAGTGILLLAAFSLLSLVIIGIPLALFRRASRYRNVRKPAGRPSYGPAFTRQRSHEPEPY